MTAVPTPHAPACSVRGKDLKMTASPTVLQYDETETGPRVRKTLALHGVTCTLERGDIGGVITHDYTEPTIDLYRYTRPSNGKAVWLVEAMIYFPPDAVIYRSWVLDEEPTDDEVRAIVARPAK